MIYFRFLYFEKKRENPDGGKLGQTNLSVLHVRTVVVVVLMEGKKAFTCCKCFIMGETKEQIFCSGHEAKQLKNKGYVKL